LRRTSKSQQSLKNIDLPLRSILIFHHFNRVYFSGSTFCYLHLAGKVFAKYFASRSVFKQFLSSTDSFLTPRIDYEKANG
jgi:hypothetical protein